MDGFNLFQDKIKGEVNYPKAADPAIFFFQQDEHLCDELFDLIDSNSGALCYQTLDWKLSLAEDLYLDFEEESPSNIEFRLDYTEETTNSGFDDFRHVMFNYNNDIALEGKKNMIMFFD